VFVSLIVVAGEDGVRVGVDERGRELVARFAGGAVLVLVHQMAGKIGDFRADRDGVRAARRQGVERHAEIGGVELTAAGQVDGIAADGAGDRNVGGRESRSVDRRVEGDVNVVERRCYSYSWGRHGRGWPLLLQPYRALARASAQIQYRFSTEAIPIWPTTVGCQLSPGRGKFRLGPCARRFVGRRVKSRLSSHQRGQGREHRSPRAGRRTGAGCLPQGYQS